MKFRSGLSIVLAAIALAGLVVTPQTAFGQARVRVYVSNPPPAAPVEVIGVAPSHRHAWVNGYHRWDGHAYVWVPGRWAVRPRARAKWAPGRWERHSRGYYWVDGRWR
jgi:WXXGXW repeat (2 copies)